MAPEDAAVGIALLPVVIASAAFCCVRTLQQELHHVMALRLATHLYLRRAPGVLAHTRRAA